MDQITLSEEQANLLAKSIEPLELLDPQGNVVGQVIPKQLAEIIERSRQVANSNQPRYSTDEVLAELAALDEEWARTGGFDHQYMQEFRKKRRLGKQP